MNIKQLIQAGALFVCNDSGGKDSRAMYLLLRRIIPHDQLVVIHAHLPEVEWPGTIDYIKQNVYDTEFRVVQARKTFFEMVDHRGMWPSADNRQCTSDLKRDPITKETVGICNERGIKLVVNCMGLRAEESPNRAKKEKFRISKRNTNSKRTWYEWLPIHGWTNEKVRQSVKEAGQELFYTYGEGMERKSCCFCILGSDNDLCIAARLMPNLATRYQAKEVELDHTLRMPKKGVKQFLTEIIK